MRILYKIASFCLLLFWQLTSFGQAEATIKLDTNVLLIGDQTELELIFTCPADYQVIWPEIKDTIISEIEILSRTDLESVESANKYDRIYRQSFTITGFDSGYYAIPPFRINFKVPGDTITHFKESDAALIEIRAMRIVAAPARWPGWIL